MHRRATICAALSMLLAGCSDQLRQVVVSPVIPPDLLIPVSAPCPAAVTEGDVARCLIRKSAGLSAANGKIRAIGEIVRQAGK